MSASIYYEPVKGKRLNIGAPSSFLEVLRRAFGEGPWTITDSNFFTLKGIEAGLDSLDQREAIKILAEAVHLHGEIRIWAEY